MFRALVLTFAAASSVYAQTSGITTYCNPIDVDYKYDFEQKTRTSRCAAADPVIVNHNGAYYLFATISGGYWHSSDLIHWNFITPDRWPFEDICAPSALSCTCSNLRTRFTLSPQFEPRFVHDKGEMS